MLVASSPQGFAAHPVHLRQVLVVRQLFQFIFDVGQPVFDGGFVAPAEERVRLDLKVVNANVRGIQFYRCVASLVRLVFLNVGTVEKKRSSPAPSSHLCQES